MIPICVNGAPGRVLLAPCADLEGTGGLYAFDGSSVTRVDPLNSSSVAVDGERLIRLPWSLPGEDAALIAYDRSGLLWYKRLDGLGDAHQIVPAGDQYVLVSTSTNSVVWLSRSGEIIREWKAPGEGDAWHLNGAHIHNGGVYVSAFGRFVNATERELLGREGRGFVLDLSTGAYVLENLSAPHHPKFVDGHWIVCSSAKHQLLVIDPRSREILATADLGGWTRGIAVSDEYIFVGISAPRHDPRRLLETARIAVLTLQTCRLVNFIPLQALEIGDLAIASPEHVSGIERGFEQLKRLCGAAIPY